MTKGALVTVVDLQSEGLARFVEDRGGFTVISFLATGAQMTQESRLVLRYALLPGTRVRVRLPHQPEPVDGVVSAAKLGRDSASGLLVYTVTVPVRTEPAAEKISDTINEKNETVREDAIVAVPTPDSAAEQLATAAFNDLRPQYAKAGSVMAPEPWGPNTLSAREQLAAWRNKAWTQTGGVTGLSAARIIPLPHQLLVAQRVLEDRQVRFLLADEVGLGKTIEAGLIIQSLLAIKPTLRVLIIVPGALISQWFLELFVRFGGQRYLMFDAERVKNYNGNPWADEQFVIASSRAVEALTGKDALRFGTSQWDVVVVDECHRMQPSGVLYKRVAMLSKNAPHVLLLSATPARQHADAYLALLSLLQPTVWRLDDGARFAARFAAHDQIVALVKKTQAAQTAELTALAKAWKNAVPGDAIIAQHAEQLAQNPEAKDALIAYVRDYLQLDRRLVRNRRQTLARLAEATGIRSFDHTTRACLRIGYTPDAAEIAVQKAWAQYCQQLISSSGKEPAPRLIHWLLQVALAVSAHPAIAERLLAMRATVLDDPEEFADYRAQAVSGETLAQVLRSDLSEHEMATHVAISAACHCAPEIENDVLQALREANDKWLKSATKKPSKRLAALISAIERFWDENPDEKILVFTTHALGIEPIREALGKAFGEKRVETFGGHQDNVAREDAARRFATQDECAILVSDPLGGEGRNFQFVSVVVHHDMPWSVAAVEQRIGRVDRLGRDGEIPSWILRSDYADALDSAWSDTLDQAVGLFTASSSGLEFIADDVEITALLAGLRDGVAGMRTALPELITLVARERAARDAQQQDDFLSDPSAYQKAGALAATVSEDTVPTTAIMRWIRSMGGAVKREEEHPKPWALRTRHLDQAEKGVFSREHALSHPHLSFFGIGQRLMDRLIADAGQAQWCRASAWRRKAAQGVTGWSGVRAIFTLSLDLAPLAVADIPLEVLRRLFFIAPPRQELMLVRADDGQIETSEAVRKLFTPAFDAKIGDLTASGAINRDAWTRPLLAGQPERIVAWQDQVRRACANAQRQVDTTITQERATLRALLDARLIPGLSAAQAGAASALQQYGADHPVTKQANNEADDELRQVTALQAAIDGATWSLDMVSYVSVYAGQ
jgi:ATP-dependent helicase HepA